MPDSLPEQEYSFIHRLSPTHAPSEHDLRGIIQTFPLIDNHAHNLLREEEAYSNNDYPFESITSEAHGHALQEHVHFTLSHIRGIKQLAELYECPPTLQDVKAARYEWVRRDYDSLIKKCLVGTHALLLDDGLPQESVYPVKWHHRHAPTVARVARIEAVASDLLEQLAIAAGFLAPGVDGDWSIDRSEAFLVRFNTMFRNQIKTLAGDPAVRGFKSVVCYRSGLDVRLSSRYAFRPHQSLADSPLLLAFHDFLRKAVRDHAYRVEKKEVNDFLVVAACDVLDKLVETEGETLPIQFHTGLGDVDIDLVTANPAYMQPLIEAFPNVDFVILHSSYPYTREAGYLAAHYGNAWLDIGEVFPMLSRHGQENVLRQALELTPTSKILWSTDGHFYPETYYLANRQFRDALESVLGELVASKDITVMQAINMTVDMLFWNSNALYKLDEARRYPQLLRACGRSSGESRRSTLVNSTDRSEALSRVSQAAGTSAGLDSTLSTAVPSPATTRSATRPISSSSIAPTTQRNSVLTTTDPFVDDDSSAITSSPSVRMTTQRDGSAQDVATFDAFMAQTPDIKYIWLQFLSYTGIMRVRMVPAQQFRRQLLNNGFPNITKAFTRLLQNDWPAAECIATGEFQLVPDLSSICPVKGLSSPSATVQTWWMESPQTHYNQCPRWALQRQVDALQSEFGISMLMGFEVEVIFVRPILTDSKSDFASFGVLHEVHSWSNMTYQDLDMLPMIEEIVQALSELGIDIEQFHAESAPTQWEFPLPPTDPIEAVDLHYKARETISNIARIHNLKATFYPRPYPMAPGSAMHAHFSINGPDDVVNKYSDSFLASILNHLPSIMAFSLALEESYARVTAGMWAGSEWVTWGTQNREAPLRKCGPGHWELKTVDGTGNMYISMAALLAAGIAGMREKVKLRIKDTPVDAATLSEKERGDLGITTMLPNTLEKSLKCLREDETLKELIGPAIVDSYIATKEAEMKFLDDMEEDKRRAWLMARF